MKLQQLKHLLQENEGVLKIGKIEIALNEGDIDFHYGGSLIQWINSKINEEADLEKTEEWSYSDGLLKTAEEESEVKKENRKLKEELEKRKESDKAAAQVEVYEKLLFGRSVNLGK